MGRRNLRRIRRIGRRHAPLLRDHAGKLHGRSARHLRHGMLQLFAGGRLRNHDGRPVHRNAAGAAQPADPRRYIRTIRGPERRRAGNEGFFPGIHRCNGEFPRHARRHHVLLQSLRHRMLRARERRGEREPRTAGRTLTVRPCKEKKKGPSLTTRTFFFGGEPPPPKMRFNRRYSTAERVPPLWS